MQLRIADTAFEVFEQYRDFPRAQVEAAQAPAIGESVAHVAVDDLGGIGVVGLGLAVVPEVAVPMVSTGNALGKDYVLASGEGSVEGGLEELARRRRLGFRCVLEQVVLRGFWQAHDGGGVESGTPRHGAQDESVNSLALGVTHGGEVDPCCDDHESAFVRGVGGERGGREVVEALQGLW